MAPALGLAFRKEVRPSAWKLDGAPTAGLLREPAEYFAGQGVLQHLRIAARCAGGQVNSLFRFLPPVGSHRQDIAKGKYGKPNWNDVLGNPKKSEGTPYLLHMSR